MKRLVFVTLAAVMLFGTIWVLSAALAPGGGTAEIDSASTSGASGSGMSLMGSP